MTSKVDHFIGSTFNTPKGGVLLVVGKERLNKRTKYIVECSICSKDRELFPENFKIAKDHLLGGRVPCGCSEKPERSPLQYEVLIKRRCKETGYEFLGWSENFKGVQTKIILHNPKTCNTWDTCSINNFIAKGSGDPVEKSLKSSSIFKIDDDLHIKDFLNTGKFLEGTLFWRSDRKTKQGGRHYWKYTCPKCSDDEYVKAGLCDGVFEGHVSNLKKGGLCCRCQIGYSWTKPQREYQIKTLLLKEGGDFIEWFDNFWGNSSKTKFKWLCPKGHDCETTISEFVNSNTRCPTCARGNFGLYTDKLEDKDYLYVLTSKLPYFKVGRSFDPVRRLSENQSRLDKHYGKGKYKFKQTRLLMADHSTIYNLEQLLVGFEIGMYDKDRPENTYGSSELIKNEYYEDVVIFCQEYVEEWWK